jgi:ABC-type antimicrobial peptide transport system permease subunit
VGGAIIGLAIALTVARVLRSLIYNVSPADPMTFISVAILVIAIAMLACYLPALRAARANPMVALRND